MMAPIYDSRRSLRLLETPTQRNQRAFLWGVAAFLALVGAFVLRADPTLPASPSLDVRILGAPMESIFTLSTLCAGVMAFRGWERLFPAKVPSLYALYPLHNVVVVARDVRLSGVDGLGILLILVAWQLPSSVVFGWAMSSYVFLYAALAALVMAGMSFALPIAIVRHAGSFGKARTVRNNIVQVAPAITFGVVIVLLLLLKLGVEELARGAGLEPLSVYVRRGDSAPIIPPNAAVWALGIPLILSSLAFVFSAVTRVRRWLKDMIFVSSTLQEEPNLSYGWIQAEDGDKTVAHWRLLVHRDVERFQRSAPFRHVVTWIFCAVASFAAFYGSDSFAVAMVGLMTIWGLAWLRIPQKVHESQSVELLAWDRLLVDDATIGRARRWTMIRIVLPYALATILPGVLYFCRDGHWVAAAAFALVCVAILIAHAVFALKDSHHD